MLVRFIDDEEEKGLLAPGIWFPPILMVIVLIFISQINFLLFHTLAELFAIIIAMLTCAVAWNTYRFSKNHFLLFLGLGYFWIGGLDLLHTVVYKGMNLFEGTGANESTQLWLGARYFEAGLLLFAPRFLTRPASFRSLFSFFALIFIVLTTLIFTKNFPDGFIDGKGLTNFKIYSEYIIIGILLGSIYHFYQKKELLDSIIFRLLLIAMIFTICAEVAFTLYISVYGFSNIVGHLFKIISFWLIFQALTKSTLSDAFVAMSQTSSTYDAIPDATIVVDEEGCTVAANPAAYKLANRGDEEIKGKNSHDLFHQKDVSVEDCPICQAISRNERVHSQELEIGDGRWFDYSISYIRDDSNSNGTVEVIRDITARKQMERDMQEVDILKRSIIDNLPLLLYVKDVKTRTFVEWNKASEEASGVPAEDILGKTDFDFWTEEHAHKLKLDDDAVIFGDKEVNIFVNSMEGDERTFRDKKVVIKDENGEPKYLLGLSENVTEQLRTEEMLRRSQKMEAIGQMSGGIAHDFNNQLGIILGYTDLLESQMSSRTQTKWISHVRKAAERCSELTKQLLVFSRHEKMENKLVDVNALLESMEELIKRSLTPKVGVTYFIAGDLWPVKLNEGRLKDAILNIVLNAGDAMPKGGSLTIETTNFKIDERNAEQFLHIDKGDYIQLTIRDTGIGMTPEVYERIFEPFYTTKKIGDGTGLGLSMVYGFVRNYKGDVLCETTSGEGSIFKIYLPRSKDKHISIEEDLGGQEYPVGNETILIVDDEAGLLSYAETIVRSWGYTVFCAQNADEAITCLDSEDIDLLFTDIVMPGRMNGYELAVEAQKWHQNLKVLMTSGYKDRAKGKEVESHFELLQKPYEAYALATRIREILDEEL